MAASRVSASALIHAPPPAVYDVIADYVDGHPRILPRPPFGSLVVEEGGWGTGTVISVQMRVLGQRRTFRAVVSEPDPGRRLVETNDSGYVTSFIVEPRTEGRHAQVTIVTEFPERPWLLGTMERWLMTRLLQPVYTAELKLLEEVAVTWPEVAARSAGDADITALPDQ